MFDEINVLEQLIEPELLIKYGVNLDIRERWTWILKLQVSCEGKYELIKIVMI